MAIYSEIDDWGSNSHYKNQFFESPPTAGFQKIGFCIFSAAGAKNTEIGFWLSKSPSVY
ncbi:hypothetical protein APA_993 [Pseudanabaena sp. lw0831]|nr:hypothetical protein APA_993 [Pseudanabaena sp. lw0831]